MAEGTLNVTANLSGNLGPGMQTLATGARQLGAAEQAASNQLTAAAKKILQSKRAQLTASQKVQFAIRKEQAAGDKLKLATIAREQKLALLVRQMRALTAAGHAIPPSMAKQAAAMNAASAAATRAAGAMRAAKVSGGALATSMGIGLHAAVFAVAGAFKSMVSDAIRTGDELQKLSQRTGVNVEELQKLRFVAKSAGVEQTSMDNALKKLGKSMGEARLKTKTYTDAFEKLGVEIEDSEGKLRPIEDVLMDVADGMAGQESQAGKLMLAQRLLGRAGGDLVNVLQEGSGALKAQGEELERMGGIMSEVATKNAEELSQALEDAGARGVGMQEVFNTQLAPALTGILNLFGDGTDQIRAWVRESKVLTGIMEGVAFVFTGGGVAISEYLNSADDAEQKQRDLKDVVDDLTGDDDSGLRGQGKAWDELGKKAKKATEITLEGFQIVLDRERIATNERKEFVAALEATQLGYIENLLMWSNRIAADQKAKFEEEKALALTRIEERSAMRLADIERETQHEMMRAKLQDDLEQQRQERLKETRDQAIQTGNEIGAAFGSVINSTIAAAAAGEASIASLAKSVLTMAIDLAGKHIIAAAATASANTFAQVSGTGPWGPFIAPAAAAAALAVVRGMVSLLPSAATGGMVTGGTAGRDSVPILTMPGEVIIPTGLAAELSEVFGRTAGRRAQHGGRVSSRSGGGAGAVTVNVTAPIGNPEEMTETQIKRWFIRAAKPIEELIDDQLVFRNLRRS